MKVRIVHDKRRMTTTGEHAGKYPIKIRLTITREKKTVQKLFHTGCFVTEAEFKRITKHNTSGNEDLQKIETKVFDMYASSQSIVNANPFIDFEAFQYDLSNTGNFKDPLSLMEAYAKELRAKGRVGNADYYDAARSSFRKFAPSLSYVQITPKWLERYERWMVEGEINKDPAKSRAPRSITTVGMYCIALRTIFNLAIEKGKVTKKLYPFGKGKYIIPTAKGRKLALSEEQKNTVLKYDTKLKKNKMNPAVRRAIDLWILSYFCYGINFADIARLRFADIKDNNIVFDRTKTINTGRDRSFIEIPLRDEVWDVIKKWGNFAQSMNQNTYVFPILRDGLTPKQIQDRVHDFIADTNAGLALACEELELPKITTYWARHTFATIAYKKGAGIEFIQKALGHTDPKTTQRYLDSFDMETRRMVSNWL